MQRPGFIAKLAKTSTFDSDVIIDALNEDVKAFCAEHPGAIGTDKKKEMLEFLLRRTDMSAVKNVVGGHGGPFGALLVDFHTGDGIPKVIGFGTNHVVPTNDPSAHAEMTAIRDTAKRLGHGDLSGLTLVTSCECCPMCLSGALGAKVEDIYFAATRDQAARVGFSDADQYRLMSAGEIEQHAQKPFDVATKANMRARLQEHDAVVEVKHGGKTYSYFGDYRDVANEAQPDPTALPVVQAIQKACAGYKELTGAPFVFHLPADTVIISNDKPHPMSLVAADWARIGRVRGADANDPALDHPQKDTGKIFFLNDEFEHMRVRDAKKHVAEVPAPEVWAGIKTTRAHHVPIPETDQNLSYAHRKWGAFIASLNAGNETQPKTIQKY